MVIGIVGLGLIGGSFAKAYSEHEEHRVLAYNRSKQVIETAYTDKSIDGELTKDNIKECDLILLCLYPKLCIDYLKEMAPYIQKSAMVIDACGTKEDICRECFPIAREYGFTFVGGHPMAGRHYSGYAYSTKTMYNGASMVLVPEELDDEATIARAKKMLSPIHFGKFTVCDPDRHDAMIAFTSQMAHVVSNAYVKSPTAKNHDGFSAGSYKDLTRVAWLNETMWTELFMENKKHLIQELDYFIGALQEYKTAMERDDADTLKQLLADGKRCKEEIDGIA